MWSWSLCTALGTLSDRDQDSFTRTVDRQWFTKNGAAFFFTFFSFSFSSFSVLVLLVLVLLVACSYFAAVICVPNRTEKKKRIKTNKQANTIQNEIMKYETTRLKLQKVRFHETWSTTCVCVMEQHPLLFHGCAFFRRVLQLNDQSLLFICI